MRKLPEGSLVAIEQQQGGPELSLRAGRSTFDLPCLPAADFPSMTDEGLSHSFALGAGELCRLFDRTRFAISTEETRYYLNGIHLHAVEDRGRLRAVATDGHRLARVEAALPEGAAGMPPIIVPRKTVNEIRKLIDDVDPEEAVEVALSNARIRFKVGRAVLRSRLIDGTFPDYERVIPTGNDKQLVAPTKALSEAVDRVATIATDKSRAVKLSLADGRLTLSAVSPDAGRAVEELDVAYAGEPLEIGFNARYILDMSTQIEGEDMRVRGRRFRLADPGARSEGRQRALCADAHARVMALAFDRRHDQPIRSAPRPTIGRLAVRQLSSDGVPLLCAPAPRGRPAARGADRPERRRQDQSARGDLVPGAGPRPARRPARRGRPAGRRRVAPGRSAPRWTGRRGPCAIGTGRDQGPRERRVGRRSTARPPARRRSPMRSPRSG